MALSAFFSKLKTGLSRSAEKLGSNIAATFTKRKLDDAALEELEDMLIAADLGPAVASR
ncbi:MAG TPA: signal recognition particle receptor subunit alpha, partial [Acidocella sp.]|nr:signal recognition particle receptor subunit alpha [Acidocella sp.]